MFVMLALMLIVSALIMLAIAAVVAVPLYVLARPHLQKRGVVLNPAERLKNLYVEGKIDLFEFERRIAQLVHVDH
jgi:hypothetical protein